MIRMLLCVLLLLFPAPWCPAGVPELMQGARSCVEKAPRYDPAYVRLDYPMGDPGWERGVCTDVVIRAFRAAGVDLQQLVHEDILRRPGAYGIRKADSNIDHRRVRNLVVFFKAHAETLPTDGKWQEGDIVVWDLQGSGYPSHIGIISGNRSSSGLPLVFHHFPATGKFSGRPSEDDCVHDWPILYHFRWKWPSPPTAQAP